MLRELQSSASRLDVKVIDLRENSYARNVWHYSRLPALAVQLGVDVVHFTYPVPVRIGSIPCATVVTLHDLYPFDIPANFGLWKGLVNRVILRECLGAVDRIACVSNSTAVQLRRYMPGKVQENSICICNCVEFTADSTTLQRVQDWRQRPFLLCVAQHRRNKNVLFLLRVFELLLRERQVDSGMRLMIVGIPGPETQSILRAIGKLGLQNQVELVKDLTSAQLQWCYSHCDAVVAPSIIEGCGLPVLEALLSGARVVCSDIPAFREFATADCRFVRLDGQFPESRFAEAIVRSLAEPKPRAIAFPQLSSQVIGKKYERLYRAVLEEHRARTGGRNLVQGTGPEPERQSI
jgi:glycosyltransferase involved in cell wall biosynthesis